MTIHLLVVDALNLIRRIHAVHESHKTSPEQPVDMARCISQSRNALEQLLQHTQPTHAVAVFDSALREPGWRHQLLPSYKEGRPAMPDDLAAALTQFQDAFAEQGVASLTAQDDEADDLAATLAWQVCSRRHQATIVSTDKGYCQLLAPTLQIRDYFQKRWLDLPFVEQEFGVAPALLPDYWGLAGISSSKIPGVAGIGGKTAATLLNRYGSLEAVLAATDHSPALLKKLSNQGEMAHLCRQVATLRRDLPLGINLQQLRWQKKS
ncbi:MAG: flap endonuclease Xni [Plesiomonas shigelloides]